MKKVLLFALCLVFVASAASANTINLWSFTDEVPRMAEVFKEMNPDFPYDFNVTIVATTDGAYQPALDQALLGGGALAPDIYCAEAGFVLKYTQGDAARFAAAYKDLGIDVDTLIPAGEIARYMYELGTRPSDGEVVGLGYQATGSALIYRRSIAKDVWGTDDPAVIKDKVGPGWQKFLEAAVELKEKGYAIVSGSGDVWKAVEHSSPRGWLNEDGKLYIDPEREVMLDLAKELFDKGLMNDTQDWTDPWFADMRDAGAQPVFAYLGPAWLINYVMAGNAGDTVGDWAICEPPRGFSWGGTWLIANKDVSDEVREGVAEFIKWVTLDTSDEGLQYMWANGTFPGSGGTKDTVGSGVVMAKSDGRIDFLGGQDMFEVYIPANAAAKGDHFTQYDETIWLGPGMWRTQMNQYAYGQKSREQAIADFKQNVYDTLDIEAAE